MELMTIVPTQSILSLAKATKGLAPIKIIIILNTFTTVFKDDISVTRELDSFFIISPFAKLKLWKLLQIVPTLKILLR